MALLGYTNSQSYLKIDKIQIENEKTKNLVITVSLYSNSFKTKKIWSNNLEYRLKDSFRGIEACQSVNDLSADSFQSSVTEYVIYENKIYQKINSKFQLDSGITGDLVFNITDNKWYVLNNDMWVPAGPEIYTKAVYDSYFSLEVLNSSNPFKSAYEFLISQPEFAHCTSDE